MNGERLYQLATELFPICRSITGDGVRKTLDKINSQIELHDLCIHEVPSKTDVFDWQVPSEWNIKDAWVKDPDGKIIIDFKNSNLHVLGYSLPIHKTLSLEELQSHLYSLPKQPDAIPYVTSYYQPRWGFCLSQEQRDSLKEGQYEVFIDSELKDGSLTYAELLLPGDVEQEVLISTYVCHPSMANNELSGPLVALGLIDWLSKQKNHYSYRFVFTTETIGTITFLSRSLTELKEKVVAGFVLTCIGDEGDYSTVQSRYADNLSDRIALQVLSEHYPDNHKVYSFLTRGSDERQYCAPGVDLPISSLMRTKYGQYPEYHTSLDNLDFISAAGLDGGLTLVKRCINLLEKNHKYTATKLGEPKLSKYNLYPTLSQKGSSGVARNLLNFLAYCDGTNDLIDIAKIIDLNTHDVMELVDTALANGLIKIA
ncbi:DUF4910 domain-containing protein [Pseudoalteromonas sp. GB56]